MTVLLTGARGFAGRHFVAAAREALGWELKTGFERMVRLKAGAPLSSS